MSQLTESSSTQDRLNVAFKAMRKQGIIARQRFSCCMNCASYELGGDLKEPKNAKKIGAVYYHKQDAQNLDAYQNFYLGFGGNPAHNPTNSDPIDAANAIKVGKLAVEALKAAGLTVEWNESNETRICIKQTRPAWSATIRRGLSY